MKCAIYEGDSLPEKTQGSVTFFLGKWKKRNPPAKKKDANGNKKKGGLKIRMFLAWRGGKREPKHIYLKGSPIYLTKTRGGGGLPPGRGGNEKKLLININELERGKSPGREKGSKPHWGKKKAQPSVKRL